MLPAGLGVTCVSPKALEAAKSAASKRCYFDYGDMVNANACGLFPLYPVAAPALRPARVARDAGRGRAWRTSSAAPLSGRRRARRGARRLEAEALRGRAAMAFRYRLRRSWCPRASTARTSSRAPLSATTSRSAPGCPRWPASCFASAIWEISTNSCCSAPSQARNGDARCGRQNRARQRRGGRAEILAQPRRRRCREPRAPRRQRRVTHRVVFLDRASLKAKVRKPSCAADYVEHEKTAPAKSCRGLQDADVAIINKVPMRAADARAAAAAEDDRGGGDRLRRGRRARIARSTASRSRTSAITRFTRCRNTPSR